MTRPTPLAASVAGSAPSHSGGYLMAPTPTIVPCPGMRRGTDCTVPTVPGLVRVMVVSAKRSASARPSRTVATTASYACQ